MKSKNIVTGVLLLFVAASIVVLAVKSLRRGAEAGNPPPANGTIIYYFHNNTRCPTCKNIQAYAHEAVKNGFAKELDEGRLQWRVVNYEQPANEHFVKQYDLIAPSVVLVEMKDGKQTRWENLVRVWELVFNKADFFKYVQDETRGYLESK